MVSEAIRRTWILNCRLCDIVMPRLGRSVCQKCTAACRFEFANVCAFVCVCFRGKGRGIDIRTDAESDKNEAIKLCVKKFEV